MAQCSYPVTLRPTKDYCVGTSIFATSTHALTKITWYKNGEPLSTATGTQSLSSEYTPVSVFPHSGIYNSGPYNSGSDYTAIGTDDVGNIYVLYAQHFVLKTTPTGMTSEIVDISPSGAQVESSGMAVDPAGNIYLTNHNQTFNGGGTMMLVFKIPAGTVSMEPADLLTAVPVATMQAATLPVSSVFVDCQKDIYLYTSNSASFYRYTPGAATATLLGSGNNESCYIPNIGEIYPDAAGNIIFGDGSGIKKWTPGTTSPVTLVSFNCQNNVNTIIPGSFWVDGNDNVYLSVFDAQQQVSYVEKWAPGATSGERIVIFPEKNNAGSFLPLTMDPRGDLLIGYGGDTVLYKYKCTAFIDSTFTPADTGAYYAIVTDVRGYTTTSDTIQINVPTTNLPSIQISATASSTPICTPITFTTQTANAGQNPSFQWQVSGVPAGGDSTSYSYNLFANGDDVYCIMATQAGCAGPVQDTSNIIQLSIDPQGAASVTIATSKDPICQGDTAAFEATVTNGSATPTYQWLLNGAGTGDDSAGYIRNSFNNGDVVTCLITSDDACGLAKSNSISLAVSTRPAVESGQIFSILHGHSLTLTPVITGDVSGYLWTPATGLSDPAIADPVADPAANTLYTLTVTAPGGCSDSGTIIVDVYTPLSIPGAFTPNGDGHNDIFYVLGDPVNSQVEDFTVYDRYGAEVFHVHDVAPGDATHGWNGYFHGSLAPLGTYVYSILMKFADGSRQVYKGTVILIH